MAEDLVIEECNKYEQGLSAAIYFVQSEIQRYEGIKNLVENQSSIIDVITELFSNYTVDILQWLNNNYSNDETKFIMDKINKNHIANKKNDKNSDSSRDQDNSKLLIAYSEVDSEDFEELMAENASEMECSDSDLTNEIDNLIAEYNSEIEYDDSSSDSDLYEAGIREDYFMGELTSNDSD